MSLTCYVTRCCPAAMPSCPRPLPHGHARRVCAFWLGRSPATFYQLYCGVGAVLMACRWALYFKRKWHYYL